jgi:hypothetical protein
MTKLLEMKHATEGHVASLAVVEAEDNPHFVFEICDERTRFTIREDVDAAEMIAAVRDVLARSGFSDAEDTNGH